MSDEKRAYRMTKRAEAEEETRKRITQSTVDLHEALGPSRTSISAIAEHAGVRRSTVYRHFPDETALFIACTKHWMAANPPPDPAPWAAISDADERLRIALNQLYSYYRRTRKMMESIHRDEEVMPLVKEMMGGYRGYLQNVHELLMTARQPQPHCLRTVVAAVAHTLSFPVWRSLAHEQGLTDEECSEIMCRLVQAAQVAGAGMTERVLPQ